MSSQKTWFRVWGSITLLLIASISSYSQSIYGTLTGVVSDASQAVVPNAKVTLTNVSSGDVRRTVTNTDGYFTFASVPAATYTVSVENPGFLRWEQTGIALGGSEKRNLDIVLQVGSASEKVEIVSATDIVTPVDSGEKSAVLTTKQLQDFSAVGRNAAEFIKIMPGFGIANTGTENRANFTGEVNGTNGNGDGGSQSPLNGAYSYNGLPGNSLDITADGAHVSDPGCNCATPVNPNTDMIQEFRVLTSNFSAENSKGPAVIATIAKAGTRDFHGMGYLYARHFAMNSNDWLNNSLGNDSATGLPAGPKPENKFFYPGGNIGGPVIIPGTGFNKNRDKLFFFTGFERMFQTLDTGLLRATVPTDAMRTGNFSDAELRKLGRLTTAGAPLEPITSAAFPGGIIPAGAQDPTGKALINLYPLPNANPNSTGGFNYVKQIVFDQNMFQWMSRVDYSISDNTKLFVRYNMQGDRQLFPIGLWWRNPPQVPYPTEVVGKNKSHSISGSLTHVFSPTLTNEFIVGYTVILFPNVFNDPSKVDRTKLGIPFQGVFKNGVTQIPSMTSWGGSQLATLLNPGGFERGGARGLFADKFMPNVADNVSKVINTHTLKLGAYYEFIINDQPANGNTNGFFTFGSGTSGGTGNSYANLLTGQPDGYNEQNFNRLNNEAYHTFEVYAQDSWKASRRLTLELGLRASHFGPWYDREGFGFAVWRPDLYNANAGPLDYTGFTWHARDKNIPLSGFPSKAIRWQPRFGLAYDVFGTSNTVIRGGWGRFYYHPGQFTTGLDASAGSVTWSTPSLMTISQINGQSPTSVSAVGIAGVDPTDDRLPRTDSWSFTISQRTPASGLFEASYVGNSSRNLLLNRNPNSVPFGTLLKVSGDPNSVNYDAYRPFPKYQDVTVARYDGYANYNALQLSWVRQRGRFNVMFNYAYGKTLGILTTSTTGVGSLRNQLNLDDNYGVLAGDRRHIFNSAYSVELGNPLKGSKIAGGVVNGWQLSGITQWQSGINLSPNSPNNNYNMNLGGATLPNGNTVTDRTILGTSQIALRPYLTCNPASNLKDKQYVNPNCFALPTVPGYNGPTILPAVYGPAFFDTDLGMYKNFQLGESKKFQLRFNAYNFLNHPLWSFPGSGTNLNLTFDPATGKVNNPNFGVTTEKQGRRIVQAAIKFYF